MAGPLYCATCGLEVAPGTAICPRDGTVLLDSSAPLPMGSGSSPQVEAEAVASTQRVPALEDTLIKDSLIGARLGDYELQRRLGAGGMGIVYEGIQPLIGKRVAVKVLRPELAEAPEQMSRLLAEARAANAIRHRGIIDIFGFGEVPDGRRYIVMEYLEGQSLDEYLALQGPLAVDEALDILDEVLGALAAAHAAGVIHRDLKPSNIFLAHQADGSRYVKLLDFGLAKQSEGAPGQAVQTRPGLVMGTPEYMSPEQASGQPVGPLTDIYSLGVVTFELVTGQRPFHGTNPLKLMTQHVEEPPPRPSELVPELPPAVDNFILRMLLKEPAARPRSAESLRRQAQRLREELAAAPAAVTRKVLRPALVPSMAQPPLLNTVPEAGELPRRALLPSGAAALWPPASQPPASQPPAAEVHPARRWLLPLGLGAAVGVATMAALLLWPREPVAPAPMPLPSASAPAEPSPAVAPVAPANTVVTEPASPASLASPAVAPPPAASPAVATAASPVPQSVSEAQVGSSAGAESPSVKAAGATEPQATASVKSPVKTLSRAALRTRIQKLRAIINRRKAQGARLSPAAESTLEALRQQAESAEESATLREVEDKLNDWQRMFLQLR